MKPPKHPASDQSLIAAKHLVCAFQFMEELGDLLMCDRGVPKAGLPRCY